MANRKLSWQLFPLARPAISVLTGALCYTLWGFEGKGPLFICILLITGLCASRKNSLIWSMVFYATFLCIGYVHMGTCDRSFHKIPRLNPGLDYEMVLEVRKAQYDEQNLRWKMYGNCFISGQAAAIPVYAWLADNREVQVDDILIVKARLNLLKKGPFPGGFDFSQYLQKKKVCYSVWIEPNQVLYHKTKKTFSFWEKWRQQRIVNLQAAFSPSSFGIYAAVLFGDSKELNPRVRRQFSDLGIAHILAVSGMHVGILISCVSAALSLLGKFKYQRWAHFLILSTAIYLYVMMCNFAPSASRAGLMAVVYYLAKALKVGQTGVNSLSFSAILLFLLDPYIIFDLGAQLSFIAMLGIFLLHPPLMEWFRWKIPLPEQLNSLICISIAAQISLAPLLLFYFGKLPVLFWLFGIPAGYFAIFIFCSGWIWVLGELLLPIPEWIDGALDQIILLCISGVDAAARSGNWVLQKSHFDLMDACLVASISIAATTWLYHRKMNKRILTLKLISLLVCVFLWYSNSKRLNTTIRSFESRKQSFLFIKIHDQSWCISQDPLSEFDQTALKASYPIDSMISILK